MTKIKVGISRLYNANPCFISNGNSVCFNLQLPDMEIVASIGKDIRHLVRIWNFGPPTDTTGRQTTTKIQPRRIPGPDVFPADCYYEVEAIQWLEVDDELAALFNERDVTAREKIFVLLRAKKNEFYRSLDFTTVLFALRFHALIASVPITEQMYVYYTDCKEEAISTSLTINVTPLVQIDALNFSSNLVPARLSFTDFLGKGWTRASDTFSWLLKAWQAQDEVLKFVSLFTPLEMVIPALPDSKTAEWYLKREKIAQLIRDSVVSQFESLG